jgi:hypothetical protein
MPAPWTIRRNARLLAVTLLVAGIQLLAPPPADAWFGWLDKFSGPGPFKGLLFDARLACFGAPTGVESPEFRAAEALTRLLIESTEKDFAQLRRETAEAWNVVFLPDRRSAVLAVQMRAQFFVALRNLRDATQQREAVLAAARGAVDEINASRRRLIFGGAIGTMWSTCGAAKDRRVSVDLSVDLWWAKGNPEFAGGEQVRFTTIMPAVSYRVFPDPDYDVLDVSMAAGWYWFTSKGFDSVDGFVVQPVRVTLHPPTGWHALDHDDIRRWLAPIAVRGALTVVPSGFKADAFNASRRERIPAEYVPTLGLYYNLMTLLPDPKKRN